MSQPSPALRALLHAIDYAGLFPPAKLSMPKAVANYAAYRIGPHSWALGRFIVPASRLGEFASALPSHASAQAAAHSWPVSLLPGPNLADDLRLADQFNQKHLGPVIDSIELKVATIEDIEHTAELAGSRFITYLELPHTLSPTLSTLLDCLKSHGYSGKIRTGGITPEAFPKSFPLAQFLETCFRAGVPFKATAGLHHAIRGSYPLTYEPGSPSATMHGFINVLLAAAFTAAGWDPAQVTHLLDDQDPAHFDCSAQSLSWLHHPVPATQPMGASAAETRTQVPSGEGRAQSAVCSPPLIGWAEGRGEGSHSRGEGTVAHSRRSRLLHSFGSCSFEEPIRDLQSLGWLNE